MFVFLAWDLNRNRGNSCTYTYNYFAEQLAVQDEILLCYSYTYFLRNHTPVMDLFYAENMQNVGLGR